jgi:acyl-[acyl-carrier-protein] desaturase
MAQVSKGEVPAPNTPWNGIVYLTLQELATRIAHRNTGKILDDPVGYELMARVAADENFHHLFYRDLSSAAIELNPSAMVVAIEHEVRTFAMPGTGIPDFDKHAQRIARAGIYDLAVHHDQILAPVVLRQWKLAELTGLTAKAEAARDRLISYLERTAKVSARLTARREQVAALT